MIVVFGRSPVPATADNAGTPRVVGRTGNVADQPFAPPDICGIL